MKIVRGDRIELDFTVNYKEPLSDDWTAKWVIIEKLGDETTIQQSGDLVRNDNTFELRITPAISELIEAGKYHLCVEIRNDVINYRKEEKQEPLEILLRGVFPTPILP